MNKNEKIHELQLKIIDLEHERDKELHKSAYGLFFGVVVFILIYGTLDNFFLFNSFKEWIKIIIPEILKLPSDFALVSLLAILIIPSAFAGWLGKFTFDKYLNHEEKIYNDWIADYEEKIKELRSKKTSSKLKTSRSRKNDD